MSHRIVRAALILALHSIPAAQADPKPAPSSTSGPAIKFDLPAAAKNDAEAGIAAFAQGDLDGARKAFYRSLDMAPDNPLALANLGAVEFRLKHFEEAEKLLKRAVRIQPEVATTWVALGALYLQQQKYDAALAALSQAVWLDPKNPQAHKYLGITIGQKRWYSGAEDELQKAIELQPEDADAHFNLALFYLLRSPPAVELARRHYQKALDLGSSPDPLVEQKLSAGQN